MCFVYDLMKLLETNKNMQILYESICYTIIIILLYKHLTMLRNSSHSTKTLGFYEIILLYVNTLIITDS